MRISIAIRRFPSFLVDDRPHDGICGVHRRAFLYPSGFQLEQRHILEGGLSWVWPANCAILVISSPLPWDDNPSC
ncbi:MAG: hypothetical protein AB7E55_19060 [Pigmentiphaga sp.]